MFFWCVDNIYTVMDALPWGDFSRVSGGFSQLPQAIILHSWFYLGILVKWKLFLSLSSVAVKLAQRPSILSRNLTIHSEYYFLKFIKNNSHKYTVSILWILTSLINEGTRRIKAGSKEDMSVCNQWGKNVELACKVRNKTGGFQGKQSKANQNKTRKQTKNNTKNVGLILSSTRHKNLLLIHYPHIGNEYYSFQRAFF